MKKNAKQGAVLHRSCWLYLERLRQLAPEFKDKTLMQVLEEQHPLRLFRLSDGSQPEQLTKQFKQLLEDAKLLICPVTGEERTLYSLRHYAITQLVAQGMTAEQIQQQVRTSATMIAKHYNHMKPFIVSDTDSWTLNVQHVKTALNSLGLDLFQGINVHINFRDLSLLTLRLLNDNPKKSFVIPEKQ